MFDDNTKGFLLICRARQFPGSKGLGSHMCMHMVCKQVM